MDISGICNTYYPDRLERVLKAYDGTDLQAFLDTNAVWRGAPVTAAEILSKDSEYEAAKAAALEKATQKAQDEANTRGDALVQQFISMSPAEVIAAFNSKKTWEEARSLIIRIALVAWLQARK